ncbi:MAG TPA: adenylate/guanylate cyclase domain-containing protein [Actinomycetota bacterium]|nr:adenylate/guanylate cyclase domain-containing protein [Actinomycetota bacterium]
MAKLKASERAKLPDSAFAYIDSNGQRRLPIHDEAHVRNALARFERVAFEDDAARERARKRLLNAAKKFGIVPVGFIAAQLQRERIYAGAADPRTLPTGFVTFLFTDMEDSTILLRRLGDRYGDVLNGVRRTVRQAVVRSGGREVDARADEFFAAFERPSAAIEAAVAFQRALAKRTWPDGVTVRVRAGIHSGRPTLTDTGYIGLSVHTAARICLAAHGGQILVSGETRSALKDAPPARVEFRPLGRHRLPGLDKSHSLFQVEADDLPGEFPPPRTS